MVAKRSEDVQGLIRANRAVARLLRELVGLAKPGVRTAELDDHARAYLARLGGGCAAPVAAHATVEGATLTLRAMIASSSGRQLVRDEIAGPVAAGGAAIVAAELR
jgi:porphobilinogen deaminase